MNKEKLIKGNLLAKEIKETEENIKTAKFTQSVNVPEIPMNIEFLGHEAVAFYFRNRILIHTIIIITLLVLVGQVQDEHTR